MAASSPKKDERKYTRARLHNSTRKVLRTLELKDLLQYILDKAPPSSHLVICMSEVEFLHQLLASISYEQQYMGQELTERREENAHDSNVERSLHELLLPTIHQLKSSLGIQVTFCASLPSLQAYLGTFGNTTGSSILTINDDDGLAGRAAPWLVFTNLLRLHSGTPSFSAQVLSRTLASAVEAAFRSDMSIILAECPLRLAEAQPFHPLHGDEDNKGEDINMHDAAEVEGSADVAEQVEDIDDDPWNQQIPILNSTTKSFGAGSRGWAGRTVSVKRVWERWFRFDDEH